MRHAGMHWPANAGGEHPSREAIYALPGVADGCLLITAESARYWYGEARERCPLVVWRAIPRPGREPANLGWNPARVADEVLNLWDEQAEAHHGREEWFLPLNELQFPKESGQDFRGYDYTALRLAYLRLELRQRLPAVRLMFPAWVPTDDVAWLSQWQSEAEKWDGVCVHAYGSAESIRGRYDSYRAAFPGMPLFIGEHNDNHEGHDEGEALRALAEVAARDPLFLGATRYIWETNNEGEQDLSVWGNEGLYSLYRHPPPIPEVEPMAEFPIPQDDAGHEWEPTAQDIVEACKVVGPEFGVPVDELLGLCIAESGDNLDSFDRWWTYTAEAVAAIADRDRGGLQAVLDRIAAAGSNDISFGPAQQTWYWWKDYPGDRSPSDPHRYNLMEILAFRKQMIQDHGGAIRLAASQLQVNVERYGVDSNQPMYRYNKPDGSASAVVRSRYDRSRDRARAILGSSPAPAPPPIIVDGGTVFDSYPDPQPAGTFSRMPLGVILHGSRSGAAGNPLDREYVGTASYEVSNGASLGWNATIGDGRVALHLGPNQWGWNARSASKFYLAVEFAQPTVDDPITEGQVSAFCDWFQQYILPAWPDLPQVFPTHSELDGTAIYGGYHDGKTDVYPRGDPRSDELRARIQARLAPAPPAPVPPNGQPDPGPGEGPSLEERLASAVNLVGNAYNDDGVVLPPLDRIAKGKLTKAEMVKEAASVAVWLRANRP